MQCLTRQFNEARVVNLWEHFWFRKVTPEDYRQIAGNAWGARNGRPNVTNQLGATLLRWFLQETWPHRFQTFDDDPYPDPASATAAIVGPEGRSVAVYTRTLREDLTITTGFDLSVPPARSFRDQDVHVLAGYCPVSEYGYLFGWTDRERIYAEPLRTELKYPVHSLPLAALFPMQDLDPGETRACTESSA